MLKYKVGDKVKLKANCSGLKINTVYILVEYLGDLFASEKGSVPDGDQKMCSCEHN